MFYIYGQAILKYIWKSKETKIAKIILKKKNKEFGRIVLSLTYYKTAAIRRMWY